MAIDWNPSHGPTLGVEWEVQLIDSQTMLLRQEAGKVLDELPVIGESGEHPQIRHELMQSTVEVVTGICSTVSEAKDDLAGMITELQRAATPHGIVLACAGTHPVSDWRDASMAPIQRYAELVEQMQWLARRIQTFGVHVHVGIRDGNKAIPIVNALAAYLPHFLGLTASSPFWCGYDTGLASGRDFRIPADVGSPAAASGLEAVRGLHGNVAAVGHDPLHQGGLVGHPAASGLRHGGDPHG
jgi:glutamate---cysteine ligase / carboxylate-amine ligase